MFKPAQPWEEFLLEKIPSGKQPTIPDLLQRWEEFDLCDDPRFPERKQSMRVPRGVGERNMYSAWLAEEMEKSEAEFFAQNILQPSKLIMLALVPEVRNLLGADQGRADFEIQVLGEMHDNFNDVFERLRRIEESLKGAGLLVGEEVGNASAN